MICLEEAQTWNWKKQKMAKFSLMDLFKLESEAKKKWWIWSDKEPKAEKSQLLNSTKKVQDLIPFWVYISKDLNTQQNSVLLIWPEVKKYANQELKDKLLKKLKRSTILSRVWVTWLMHLLPEIKLNIFLSETLNLQGC